MAIICTIKVVPGSGLQKAILDKSGRLKIYLKNQPESGRANKELIEYVSDMLSIPQRAIEIVAGETSRTKMVRIDADITFEKLLALFGIDTQTTLV